jgi:hypothetical protein
MNSDLPQRMFASAVKIVKLCRSLDKIDFLKNFLIALKNKLNTFGDKKGG